MAEKPFEVGLVKAASTEVKAKKAAWFQDPSQVHREPSNGKGIKKSSARNEFRARETAKMATAQSCRLPPVRTGTNATGESANETLA
jgi:hypothetical protein